MKESYFRNSPLTTSQSEEHGKEGSQGGPHSKAKEDVVKGPSYKGSHD